MVLSIRVTKIISINFVVYYWPLLKSGGAQRHLVLPPTKKVRGSPLPASETLDKQMCI
jgi:hypothetical protein